MINKVAVVIPCYKEYLTSHEQIAAARCREILGDHPIVIVKPEGLTIPGEITAFKNVHSISFDAAFFNGIAGYNKLMLSAEFYSRLLDFEYILIYQLDAFVFRDDLTYWCSKNYDYIGAPWLSRKTHHNFLKKQLLNLQRDLSYRLNLKKRNVPNKYQFENRVGNGGFSLRKVDVFYKICIEMKPRIDLYLSKTAHQYNEDAFWSLEVNRKGKKLAIPHFLEAINFCFETYPDNALKLTYGELPFGCHDWDHYPGFWRPVFKKFGFDI